MAYKYVGGKMDKEYMYLFLGVFAIFALGWMGGISYMYITADSATDSVQKTDKVSSKQAVSASDMARFEEIEKNTQNAVTMDLPSPSERISRGDILVLDDEVVLKVNNPQWAIFTDTNSMDPVIDDTSKAIEVVPKSADDIKVGDIVAYKSKYKDGIIAHRIVETGYDALGWYARIKGDNNNYIDPGKIRFDQIERVVVAIIY